MRVSGPIAYIILYAALYAAFGVASPFWPKIFRNERFNFPADRFRPHRCHVGAARRRPIGWDTCPCFEVIAPCARNLCCLGIRNGRCLVVGKYLLVIAYLHCFNAGSGTCPHDVACRRVIGQRSEAPDSRESLLNTAGYEARRRRLSCWAR